MKNSVKSILKRSITAALAVLLAIMSFAIAGCSNSEDDLDYVKKNGKLVIGITEYPPMDYQESGSDEWVGFDAAWASRRSSSSSTGEQRSPLSRARPLTACGTA